MCSDLCEANFIKAGHKATCKRIVILTTAKYYGKCVDQLKSVFTRDYSADVYCYESILKKHSTEFHWPVFHLNTVSSLCYISGTTENPKGVLYSHRSTMLHAVCTNETAPTVDSCGFYCIASYCIVIDKYR
jgi:acyl-CoA synthetase (AMP-forming)/AMP-acid ligase II